MSVVRSALAGLATGGRTFSGIGALVATVPPGTTEEPDATLSTPAAQAAIGLLAAGEVLADKLPFAPSRMEFPGIHGRVVFGAACGVVIARRSATATSPVATPPDVQAGAPVAPGRPGVAPAQVAVCAAVGAATAFAGAWLGVRFRDLTGRNRALRILGAVVEDAAVVGLSAAAVKAPAPVN